MNAFVRRLLAMCSPSVWESLTESEIADLRGEVAAQRDEIVRLAGALADSRARVNDLERFLTLLQPGSLPEVQR